MFICTSSRFTAEQIIQLQSDGQTLRLETFAESSRTFEAQRHWQDGHLVGIGRIGAGLESEYSSDCCRSQGSVGRGIYA